MFTLAGAPDRQPDIEIVCRPEDSRPITMQVFHSENGRHDVFFSPGPVEDALYLEAIFVLLMPVIQSCIKVRSMADANREFKSGLEEESDWLN